MDINCLIISKKMFCITAFSEYFYSCCRVGIFIPHGHLIQKHMSYDRGAACYMRCPDPLSLSFVAKLGQSVSFTCLAGGTDVLAELISCLHVLIPLWAFTASEEGTGPAVGRL